MKFFYLIFTFALLAFLNGCASITGSKYQGITVVAVCEGKQVEAASCSLTNDSGVWYVTTPGSVFVHKSTGDMSVSCKKDDAGGTNVFRSTSAAGMWGNILMGGPIGAAIDAGTGAGFDYPNTMNIQFDKCPTPPKKQSLNETINNLASLVKNIFN